MIVFVPVFIQVIKRGKRLFDGEIWKFALKFNLPLIPHFLSTIILQQSDRIMIGNICGKEKAAIYGVSYSVATVLLIINTAVIDSIIPWTYNCLKQKKYDKLPFVSFVSLLGIVFLNIIATLCAPEIITIMAPESYYQAVYIIPPVAISNVFIFMYNLFANIEYFYEKTKLVAVASCASAIINIVLNSIFINIFGFIAAGYTTMVCYIMYAIFHYCFMRYILRKQNINVHIYSYGKIWVAAFCGCVLSIGIILLFPYFFIRVGLLFIICIFAIINRKSIINYIIKIKNKEF